MENTRQRLSQRRKAATVTQAPLTGGIGAERSTVARWGASESLHSPRTNTTLAPGASLDQVADLFTESKGGTTQTPSTGTARPASSDDAGAEVLGAARTRALNRPFMSAISSRLGRLKRFPAVGVLALIFAGGAVSMPFVTSPRQPAPPTTAGTPASTTPVAADPAPGSSSGNDNSLRIEDSSGAIRNKPAAVPNTPAGGHPAPSDAPPPVPHNTQSINGITSEHKPATATGSRPPERPTTPAEAYDAWSRAAGLDAGNQPWTRLRSPRR